MRYCNFDWLVLYLKLLENTLLSRVVLVRTKTLPRPPALLGMRPEVSDRKASEWLEVLTLMARFETVPLGALLSPSSMRKGALAVFGMRRNIRLETDLGKKYEQMIVLALEMLDLW